ncbi:transposase [Streptomyces sp. V1I1]|nr:transposase [Streptomyces sp. V1I1]
MIYRPRRHTDHKQGGRRSFVWTEYRDLLIAAHRQLNGPIVLIRDNLNVHKDARMRAFIDAQDWIDAHYLPPYAPDLNPVEGIWSLLRRGSQANTAFTDPDLLIRVLRHGLRQIQCRSDIIDGCLTETRLKLTTPRPQASNHPQRRQPTGRLSAGPARIREIITTVSVTCSVSSRSPTGSITGSGKGSRYTQVPHSMNARRQRQRSSGRRPGQYGRHALPCPAHAKYRIRERQRKALPFSPREIDQWRMPSDTAF